MSDTPETQSAINAWSSLAMHHRIARSPRYLDMIDAAIDRAAHFRATGEWPERETKRPSARRL
jgi:hypothetical protein